MKESLHGRNYRACVQQRGTSCSTESRSGTRESARATARRQRRFYVRGVSAKWHLSRFPRLPSSRPSTVTVNWPVRP
jgi:hypothetical protein